VEAAIDMFAAGSEDEYDVLGREEIVSLQPE
jgi:hypothetical protein